MKWNLEKLHGAFTALISPFDEDYDLDKDTYIAFIRKQIQAGCGLVPCGTTGESATMSHEEHHKVMEWCVHEAKNSSQVPFVLAGSGSNSTSEAIDLSRHAQRIGVDGLLIITPYYNKPTQRGLIAHYSAIAEEVDIPIVLYNVPSRTGRNMLPDTVAELAKKYDNIVGLKAASGDIEQIKEVIAKTPDDFLIISGDDGLTYEIMKAGGKGLISVASNIIPDRIVKYVAMMENGEWDKATEENKALQSLFKNLFIETNPGPVKYCAELLGLMSRRMRLPMVPPEPESQEVLKKTLREIGLEF